MAHGNDPSDNRAVAPQEVGYKKPPKETQFKKGTSGNPVGRPKGSKNQTTILAQIAEETHRIKIDGHIRDVKIIDLLFYRLRQMALQGDEKALGAYTDWLNRLQDETESSWSVGLYLIEGYYCAEDSPLPVIDVEVEEPFA